MRNIKKLACLLLAICLALSCVACGNAAETTPAASTTTAAQPEATTPAATTEPAATTTEPAATEPEAVEPVEEQPQVEIPHSDKFVVADGKVSFTNALGEECTLTINPERVVVLSNNWTDLWYDCGGTVVGRVDEPLCALRNEDAINAKIIGSSYTVSYEAILAETPTLVILSSTNKTSQDFAAALKEAGIEYLSYDYSNFEGFLECLELYTIMTGRPDLYDYYAADNIVRVNAVREICAQQEPKTVVMLLPHAENGIYALQNSGFLGNLLTDCNTINVAFTGDDALEKTSVISLEKLLEWDPEFILSRGGSGDGSVETANGIFESYPVWSELSAVKAGKNHHLPSELFLYKANTRYGEAYEYLAKILYPEAFQ